MIVALCTVTCAIHVGPQGADGYSPVLPQGQRLFDKLPQGLHLSSLLRGSELHR